MKKGKGRRKEKKEGKKTKKVIGWKLGLLGGFGPPLTKKKEKGQEKRGKEKGEEKREQKGKLKMKNISSSLSNFPPLRRKTLIFAWISGTKIKLESSLHKTCKVRQIGTLAPIYL